MKRQLLLVLISLAWCCSILSETRGQEPLAWKFKTGQTRRFKLECLTFNSTIDTKGELNPIQNNTNLSQTFSIQTKEIKADGSAVLAFKFESIKQITEPIRFGVVNFDTAKESKDDTPLIKLWRGLIGKDITYRMSKTGEVEEFLYGDSLFQTIKASGVTRAMASEKTFDELIAGLFPSLPTTPIQKGDPWQFIATNSNPSTKMITTQVLTLNDLKNERAYISLTPSVEFRHSEISGIRTKIEKQEGSGSMIFDTESGEVVESRSKILLISSHPNFPDSPSQYITIDQTIKLVK